MKPQIAGPIDPKRVAARRAGRELADESWPLLEEQMFAYPGYHADFCDAMVCELVKLIPKRKEQAASLPGPARHVSFYAAYRATMGFHIGRRLGDVSDADLDRYIRQLENELKAVKAYINHPDYKG